MALQEIDRSTANDGLGDDARTWAGKTNDNMKELFSRCFKLGNFLVQRWDYDPNALSFDAYKLNDKVEGFVDTEKTHFISGIILDASIDIATEYDDTTKFFSLINKVNVNV